MTTTNVEQDAQQVIVYWVLRYGSSREALNAHAVSDVIREVFGEQYVWVGTGVVDLVYKWKYDRFLNEAEQ